MLVGIVALILISLLDVFLPLIIREALDILTSSQDMNALTQCAVAYLLISIVLAALRVTWRVMLSAASANVGRDLRAAFLKHLLNSPMNFFSKTKTGDLTALANNDIDSIRYAYDIGVVIFIDAVCGVIFIPIAMLVLSPTLAIILFLPLFAIPLITYLSDRKIHRYFKAVQEAFAELCATAQESLLGVGIIKSFAKEHTFISRYSRIGESYVARAKKLAGIEAIFGPSLEFTVILSIVLHILIGGAWVMEGTLSIGTFVAFIRFLQNLAWPMQALGLSVTVIQKALVGADRVSKVFAEETEKNHYNSSVAKIKGHIEFQGVNFKYPGSDKLILSNVSFSVKPGERVAFVGEIGSGKSSLLQLIPRLYEVTEGQILIDGLDIRSLPLNNLRQEISFVMQEPQLFRRSILENVAYNDSSGVVMERVETAVRIAGIYEEIINMPSSYQTVLGERGVNISGGQKQRLSIARAIYRNAPILILDDALSAVDMDAERRILQGFEEIFSNYTVLMATHRLASVRVADRIIVLENGRIIQHGTHDELMKFKDGWYKRFYDEQVLEEKLLAQEKQAEKERLHV